MRLHEEGMLVDKKINLQYIVVRYHMAIVRMRGNIMRIECDVVRQILRLHMLGIGRQAWWMGALNA